jgi:hypothetical protein
VGGRGQFSGIGYKEFGFGGEIQRRQVRGMPSSDRKYSPKEVIPRFTEGIPLGDAGFPVNTALGHTCYFGQGCCSYEMPHRGAA